MIQNQWIYFIILLAKEKIWHIFSFHFSLSSFLWNNFRSWKTSETFIFKCGYHISIFYLWRNCFALWNTKLKTLFKMTWITHLLLEQCEWTVLFGKNMKNQKFKILGQEWLFPLSSTNYVESLLEICSKNLAVKSYSLIISLNHQPERLASDFSNTHHNTLVKN